MPVNYEFWSHGIQTVVQYPDRARSVTRSATGTTIVQGAPPAAAQLNYLHVPLVSSPDLHSSLIMLGPVELRAYASPGVVIRRVAIRTPRRTVRQARTSLSGRIHYVLDLSGGRYDRVGKDGVVLTLTV